MPTRAVGLAIAVIVLVCSCGGGGKQPLSTWETWKSEPFGDLRVSADGRFVSARNGESILVYSRELSLLGEFSSPEYPGPHGRTPFLGTNPVSEDGYCIYTVTAAETEGGGDAGAGCISCLDDAGDILWSTQLHPTLGSGISDLAIGPDDTHYLLDREGIQALDAGGLDLWFARVGAQQLVIADDGRLYARTDEHVFGLTPDDEVGWERPIEELAGTKRVLEFARLLEAGPSLLVVFSYHEIFAFSGDGEPQWRFADSPSSAERDYMDPLIDDDGRLYFLLREKRWLTEPYKRHEYFCWLGAIDTQTGELVLEVPLADGVAASMLGIDEAGQIVVASRVGGHVWDTLSHYSPAGVLLSQRELAHHAKSIGVVKGVPALSPTGVIYYQSTTPTAPDREDNMLVAIDLAGNVLGTAVTLRGEWQTVYPPPDWD